MMQRGLHSYFNTFADDEILVERPGEVDPFDGTETQPAQTILEGACDLQRTGQALRRAQILHEEADAVAFLQAPASGIRPTDKATIAGVEYTVIDVRLIDDSLVLRN